MAKQDFDIAAAFALQAAEGTFDATLAGITTDLYGDPDGTDHGLVLGDPESGIGESGISLSVGRRRRDKAVLAGGFTRPLSDWLAAEVRTLSFSWPFCGNRGLTTASPVPGDFEALVGVKALLAAAGLVGTTDATPGWSYKFGSPNPISVLLYYFGNKLQLKDCRASSLKITWTPGGIAVASIDLAVGAIDSPSAKGFLPVSIPTLHFGAQATVSAPVVEGVGHTWQDSKGFEELTLTISPAISEAKDSNADGGIVKGPSGREVTLEGTIYASDADEVYELDQAFASVVGDLDQLSFQVGDDATGSDPALASQIIVPQPELDEAGPAKITTYGANAVKLFARNDTVNEELEILFR